MLCHPRHPLAGSADVAWADLAEETWLVAPTGVAARDNFEALCASFPHPPGTYPVITRSSVMLRWVLRNEDVLAYLPFTYVRPMLDAGEVAEIKVKPQVDIQPLGLLQPSEGLAEAPAQLSSFLQRRFSSSGRVDRTQR